MTLQIRRAEVKDVELLCQLNKSIHDLHAGARPDIFKPYQITPELLSLYQTRLKSDEWIAYIGEVNGAAVGYIVIEIVTRPENPFAYAAKGLVIDQLSVNPEHHRHGYGAQLMESALELARQQGIKHISLNVWGFNKGAQAFYEQVGFSFSQHRMEMLLG